MKYFLKIFAILSIAGIAVQASAQNICGTQISGAKTEQESEQKARELLAMAINSKVSFQSKSEETIDGRKSSQKDTTIQNVNSGLLNAQAIKYSNGKNETGYSSQACMSVQDAAKPYLDSLRYLSGALKNSAQKINKESCQNIEDAYKNIKSLEGILEPLKQMESEKEYETIYSKAKEECGKAGKGIYIESENEDFANRMASFFQDFGCDIAENSLSASITLSLNDFKIGDGCEQGTVPSNNQAYCYACVKKINLQDSKTGKSLFKDPFKSSRAQYLNMETACRMALENSAQELWNKMKSKIKKENCK